MANGTMRAAKIVAEIRMLIDEKRLTISQATSKINIATNYEVDADEMDYIVDTILQDQEKL